MDVWNDTVENFTIADTIATNFNSTEKNLTTFFNDRRLYEAQWSLPWRLFLTITLCLIIICAIIGNVMVVMVIARHQGMRTRTNMFLCSLACADFLCAVLNMPVSLATVITGRWIFSQTVCYINGFLSQLTFITSVHTLMYIAIHKVVSIKKPFIQILTHNRILLMIFCAWTWGAILGYLTIHGLSTVTYKPFSTRCTVLFPSDARSYFLEGFTYFTCYLLPLIVMIACYGVMCCELKAHALRMVLSTTTDKDVIFIQQRRITFTLFIVFIIFIVCWTPYTIYAAYTVFLRDHSNTPDVVKPLVQWLAYLSCAFNPLIYAWRSPAFREGYRQLFCCTRRSGSKPRTKRSHESRSAGRFRAFLRGTTLHASGSLTGTPAHTPPTSRKSSTSSVTNYLLFPKTRTLSTSSLPGNFRFSTLPLILDRDTTQVSFIAGIPVLTKGGKIVSYINPHETGVKRRTPPYYSKTPQRAGTSAHSEPTAKISPRASVGAVNEKSPLIPRPIAPAAVVGRGRPGRTPALAPHLEVPEILIEDDANAVVDGEDDGLMLEYNRASCESGFNDHLTTDDDTEDDDDQVFIVVADVEPPPTRRTPDNSRHNVSDAERTLSLPAADAMTGSDSLSVPGPSYAPRHRVCKSVSDACDRDRPVISGRQVTKSTSDTCITESGDGDDRSAATTQRYDSIGKKTAEKSGKRKLINRLFSRTKKEHSPKNGHHDSSRLDLHNADDVSDSGMASGVSGHHESPAYEHSPDLRSSIRDKTSLRDLGSHSFGAADSRTRDKASTLDNRGSVKTKAAVVEGHRALSMSRSSSDPSLSRSKHSKHQQQHDKRSSRVRGKSRRSHDKRKQQVRSRERSRDLMDVNLNEGGSEALQRSRSMRAGRYPSVEKLDGDLVSSDAAADVKRKLRRLNAAEDSSSDAKWRLPFHDLSDIQPIKVLSLTDPRMRNRLQRSFSEPGLTFKKIEEKVLQRSLTKRWRGTLQRCHTRRPFKAKHRLNVSDRAESDNRVHALETDAMLSAQPRQPHLKQRGHTIPRMRALALPDSSAMYNPQFTDVLVQPAASQQHSSVFTIVPSQQSVACSSHSGQYLSLNVPLNETSPICLSNVSLNQLDATTATASPAAAAAAAVSGQLQENTQNNNNNASAHKQAPDVSEYRRSWMLKREKTHASDSPPLRAHSLQVDLQALSYCHTAPLNYNFNSSFNSTVTTATTATDSDCSCNVESVQNGHSCTAMTLSCESLKFIDDAVETLSDDVENVDVTGILNNNESSQLITLSN